MSEKRNISKIPAGVALLLGAGALSAASGNAGATNLTHPSALAPVSSLAPNSPGIQLWTENSRIYLSEASGGQRELTLGSGQQKERLVELLQRAGASAPSAAIGLPRILLAGGGGDGFHFTPRRSSERATAISRAKPGTSTETGPAAPPDTNSPIQKTPEGAPARRG